MTEGTCKEGLQVGDVVAWHDVPDGALVRDEDGDDVGTMVVRCDIDYGRIVWHASIGRWRRAGRWSPWDSWWSGRAQHVTIIALGLTGSESADDLRRLAEIFEVREALAEFPAIGGTIDLMDMAAAGGPVELAERLYAAGWRPGDSAERAAELLAAAEGS